MAPWKSGLTLLLLHTETRLSVLYTDLLHSHEFVPVAVETAGVFGLQTMSFVREFGEEIEAPNCGREIHNIPHSTHLSIAVQRGNAISVLGTHYSLQTILLIFAIVNNNNKN